MLPIADQTAGPNGLKFFVDTHGGRGMFKAKKTNFFSKKIFHGQRRAPSASIRYCSSSQV